MTNETCRRCGSTQTIRISEGLTPDLLALEGVGYYTRRCLVCGEQYEPILKQQ